MDFSSIIKPGFRRHTKPPKYFEEFYGLEKEKTKFPNQRPSNIYQTRMDDR